MGMKVAPVSLALDYTTSLPTGASEASPRLASNLKLYERPRRVWRSSDTTSEAVIFDLGSAKVLKGAYANYGNFPTIAWAVSSSSTFASDVTTLVTGGLNQDYRVAKRRHGFYDFPSNALSKRYVRMTPSGTPDASAAYFQLGVVALFDTVTDLSDGPAFPLVYTPRQARTVTPFQSGGREINTEGDVYLEWAIQSQVFLRAGAQAVLNQLLELIATNPGPYVVWENRGFTEHAYLFQRTEDVAFSENSATTFGASLTLVEAI